MAWTLANLFVRGATQDQVRIGLRQVWVGAAARRADNSQLQEQPPPITITPPVDGWLAITGLRCFVIDLPWASQALSRASDSLVLSCELAGLAYRLRYTEYDKGARQDELLSPEVLWQQDDTSDYSGPMPFYEDVESLAYRRLAARGVPHRLIYLGISALGREAAERYPLGQAICATPDDFSVDDTLSIDAQGESTWAEAPILPNAVSRDWGLLLLEQRYLEGRPNARSIDHLLELEEAWRLRAQALQREEVHLAMTYYGGRYQTDLDRMLRKRGRMVVPTARPDRRSWWYFWRFFSRVR
jgi:hypothetical protein